MKKLLISEMLRKTLSHKVTHIPNRKKTDDHIILFGRYPLPGFTKTRLIPALGELGAAECHRIMTEKIVDSSSDYCRNEGNVEIRFYYDGASEIEFKKWLGTDINFNLQSDGDIGRRMRSAAEESIKDGAEKIIITGTDIPDLGPSHLKEAFEALDSHELVLGPSFDGGYWLIGLRGSAGAETVRALFSDIEWSTDRVLSQTLAIAEKLNLKGHLLEVLNDLDTPDDLLLFKKEKESEETSLNHSEKDCSNQRKELMMIGEPVISVIIPALNEEANIGEVIDSASAAGVEIIVVDGGSSDKTVSEAAKKGGMVLTDAQKGRSAQQNRGAKNAKGRIFLFLHADTRLPDDYEKHIFRVMLNREIMAGAFSFRTDSDNFFMRLISIGVNIRSNFLKLPYGDQALFFRRRIFEKAGGFPAVSIAEDLLLVKDLLFGRKLISSKAFTLLPLSVTTSARRWRSKGILLTTVINIVILFATLINVPPERVAPLYGTRRDEPRRDRPSGEKSPQNRSGKDEFGRDGSGRDGSGRDQKIAKNDGVIA